ncbi:MAG: hypothetical protein L6R48_26100, partial [Planctomycetes bacterium]|nr:hypothetical protein [Planctomycetota bacterium]
RLLEEAVRSHRASGHLQRFRHLFFVRREDLRAAAQASKAIAAGAPDDGPEDQLAELYFNQGRYLEALAELERLLGRGVEDRQLQASVLARSGACLRQQG